MTAPVNVPPTGRVDGRLGGWQAGCSQGIANSARPHCWPSHPALAADRPPPYRPAWQLSMVVHPKSPSLSGLFSHIWHNATTPLRNRPKQSLASSPASRYAPCRLCDSHPCTLPPIRTPRPSERLAGFLCPLHGQAHSPPLVTTPPTAAHRFQCHLVPPTASNSPPPPFPHPNQKPPRTNTRLRLLSHPLLQDRSCYRASFLT